MDVDRGFAEFMKNLGEVILSVGNPRRREIDIERNYDIKKNVNLKMCRACGGKCCKKCGCHFAPTDFKELTFEYLREEIEKGYISIDCVDGEMFFQRGFFYILRVRNVGAPIVDFGSNRSQCCLLTDKGCKLSYKERPSGGKLLVPVEEFFAGEKLKLCKQNYGIDDCCYEWEPYADIIGELIKYFEDKDFPCAL